MRSDANLRLSECQPRHAFGSSPASSSALFHQFRTGDRLAHLEGSMDAGNTGSSPVPGYLRCASSKAAIASAVTGVRCS